MGKEKGPSDVQLLKTPSGDAMMVVSIDKRTLGSMLDKGLVVGIFDAKEIELKIPLCLVRYDRLKIDKDLIIQPGFVRIK
jgi:hypothetical protein